MSTRDDARARLEFFVGEWTMAATFPADSPMGAVTGTARSSFEWALDGAFLLQRSEAEPPVPRGLMLVDALDDGSYTQHYFDSRGVVRLYAMTFDGARWTLTREGPDFSPFDFAQRFVATLEDGGRTMRGAWEMSEDGTTWRKDFDLVYSRAG
jgi:hypothetical protein